MTTAPPAPRKPAILFVDDEGQVLSALALHLGRRYEVLAAQSGAAGLALLATRSDVEVVVSDMRMPQMDGAGFLAQVRQSFPDVTRILLTGETDLRSAIAAVNDGGIFRFLLKPTAPAALIAAIEAAREQHELVTSKRVLLEQTLHGAISALLEVLGLTSPVAFGRASRVKKLASELAQRLSLENKWQIEVAAMMSQLGAVALPPETLDRIDAGRALDPDERAIVERLPATVDGLLGPIPRLEPVRAILGVAHSLGPPRSEVAPALVRAGRVLRAALDFDALVYRGMSRREVLETLRARGRYDEDVLVLLGREVGGRDGVLALSAQTLRPGLVLAEDVRMTNGSLLATRGCEVTPAFVARIRNFKPGTVAEPIRVFANNRTVVAA